MVSEELEAKEKDATQQMKELKNQSDFWNSIIRRISVLSKALNLEEPQYIEEDVQTRSGFEVVPRGFFDLAAHDGAALRDLQQPPLRRADPRRRRRRSHRARQCSGFDSPSLQAEISPFLLAASKGSIEICQLCMERLPAAELHAVDKVPKYPRFYA